VKIDDGVILMEPRPTGSVATPGNGKIALYLDSATGSLVQKDSAGTVNNTGGSQPVDANGTPFAFGVAPQGGAISLSDRINTISNFASPNAGGIVSGNYYDNSFQGTASSTLAGATNRIDLAAYYTSINLPINQIGVAVSTAVAGANVKIVIYNTGANGWPNALLYESADISAATAAYAFATLSFTFLSGTIYWVGVRHSSTATLRTINVSSACNYGLVSSSGTTYANVLRKSVAFANPAPNPWGFAVSDLVAATPPSIRFRAA
jgi:hypothetical protein